MSERINELKQQLMKVRKAQNVYEEEIHYLEEILSTTFGSQDALTEDLTYSKEQYNTLQTAAANIIKLINKIQDEERSANV